MFVDCCRNNECACIRITVATCDQLPLVEQQPIQPVFTRPGGSLAPPPPPQICPFPFMLTPCAASVPDGDVVDRLARALSRSPYPPAKRNCPPRSPISSLDAELTGDVWIDEQTNHLLASSMSLTRGGSRDRSHPQTNVGVSLAFDTNVPCRKREQALRKVEMRDPRGSPPVRPEFDRCMRGGGKRWEGKDG